MRRLVTLSTLLTLLGCAGDTAVPDTAPPGLAAAPAEQRGDWPTFEDEIGDAENAEDLDAGEVRFGAGRAIGPNAFDDDASRP
jgi:hypothetical protein